MKFEYRILNMSEVATIIAKTPNSNFLTVLNDLGNEGWELVFKLTESSFILKRQV